MAKSTIIIDQHGNMTIKEEGFTGTACAERTAKLLEGMRAKNKAEAKTPEYYSKVRDQGRATVQR